MPAAVNPLLILYHKGVFMQDYDEFVNKFKPKKTTDDCYTPPAIYEAVLRWCEKEYGIDRASVIRPFKPGGGLSARRLHGASCC